MLAGSCDAEERKILVWVRTVCDVIKKGLRPRTPTSCLAADVA
jgi:hypothetical protein